MYQVFELLKDKSEERNKIFSELRRKTVFANQVMQDVYSERERGLKDKQSEIARLLADGDFESAMEKLSAADVFMTQSPDDEIKERLSEYNLRKCN